MFSPAVITSKAASQDMENIKAAHADLLTGMSNQAVKVGNFQQNKQAELAQQNSMNMEMNKAKMVADTTMQKNAMDFQQKQAELDIKRASLSEV